MHGTTTEGGLAAIDRITRDDQSRRELSWLRAQEKGDIVQARRILDRDPTIPTRLRFFHEADFGAMDGLDRRRRADRYAALYDAHLDWLFGGESSEHEKLERRRLTLARLRE